MGLRDAWRALFGVEAEQPRTRPTARRAFQAARIDRLTSDWLTTPRPADADLRQAYPVLIARSRDLIQNNDHAKRFVQLVQDNVVGAQGITLQARSRDPDGTLDRRANEAIEAWFGQWCRFGCEMSGQMTWPMVQRLAVASWCSDGEILLRMHAGTRRNDSRFAIELLDPVTLEWRRNETLQNGNVIRMGVEVDEFGKRIAYHFRTSPQTADHYTWQGGQYMRVPASQIIHLFLPSRVGQTRGVPPMASSMYHLQMLGGYEEAELVAARTAAAKMGFFERNADGEGMQGDSVTDDGEIEIDADPGTFGTLPSGVKFHGWDPQHPTSAFPNFIKAMLRSISSGFGVSYHALANDLEGVNYTSSRTGELHDRAHWLVLQDWISEGLVRPIFETGLLIALSRNLITVTSRRGTPRPLSPGNFEKFRAVSLQGRRWQWVDPLKEITAAEKEVALGARSVSSIIRERGGDPEEVWAELEADRERLAALGVVLPTANQPAPETGDDDDDNESDDDDESDD